MYSLLNKFNFNKLLILFCVIVAQIYVPSIRFNQVIIIPDFILIFCTYLVLSNRLLEAIVFSFLLSFVQDMTFNLDMAGIFSFSKLVCIYLMGFINDYEKIWTRQSKLTFICMAYLINYLIFYSFLLMFNPYWTLFIQSILFQTLLSFLIFYLIDIFIYNIINRS